jgi:hypothetical protein
MKSGVVLLFAGVVLGLSVSCASQPSGGSERAPSVKVEQVGYLTQMELRPLEGVPLQYRLTIENPFDHEVTLRAVEIQTVGQLGGYSMKRVRHPFDEAIGARARVHIDFRAWVRVLTESDTRYVDQPVLLQGTAQFEGPSGKMLRSFSARANQ